MMPSKKRYTLKQYVRRAHLYGCDCLFETAVQRRDLKAEELLQLALVIRDIDPKWRMDRNIAEQLINLLYERYPESVLQRATGLSTADFNLICDLLECSNEP